MNSRASQLTSILILAAALLAGPANAANAEETSREARAAAKLAAQLKTCRASFAAIDARIDKAGVRDASYHQVEGFPYLRSDRLMASFSKEVDDPDTFSTWILQLRDNESFSRDIELRNLGLPNQERAGLLSDLRLCSVWLSLNEMDNGAMRDRLIKAVPVPPAPVAAKPAPAQRDAQIKAEFSQDLAKLTSDPLTLWEALTPGADEEAPPTFDRLSHDELGRSGMTSQWWSSLAEAYAPRWLIETAGSHDSPGAPVWLETKDQGTQLGINLDQPTVYYQASYMRFGGRSLIQFTYCMFFQSTTPNSAPLDGMVWRVTLDPVGKPLIYDSVRMDGSDHLWFPAQALPARAKPKDSSAPVLAPQTAPSEPWAVRLKSADHRPRRLVAMSTPVAGAKKYALKPYEDLQTLDLPKGGTRSIFGPTGILAGANQQNAPLQLSVLPAGPNGKRYFDDPYLIDAVFLAPSWPQESPHSITARDVPPPNMAILLQQGEPASP